MKKTKKTKKKTAACFNSYKGFIEIEKTVNAKDISESFNSYKGFIEIFMPDKIKWIELHGFNSYKGFIEIFFSHFLNLLLMVSIPIKDSLKFIIANRGLNL